MLLRFKFQFSSVYISDSISDFFTLSEVLIVFNQFSRCFKSALTSFVQFFDRVTQT